MYRKPDYKYKILYPFTRRDIKSWTRVTMKVRLKIFPVEEIRYLTGPPRILQTFDKDILKDLLETLRRSSKDTPSGLREIPRGFSRDTPQLFQGYSERFKGIS